jgi:hypothetical protein
LSAEFTVRASQIGPLIAAASELCLSEIPVSMAAFIDRKDTQAYFSTKLEYFFGFFFLVLAVLPIV